MTRIKHKYPPAKMTHEDLIEWIIANDYESFKSKLYEAVRYERETVRKDYEDVIIVDMITNAVTIYGEYDQYIKE